MKPISCAYNAVKRLWMTVTAGWKASRSTINTIILTLLLLVLPWPVVWACFRFLDVGGLPRFVTILLFAIVVLAYEVCLIRIAQSALNGDQEARRYQFDPSSFASSNCTHTFERIKFVLERLQSRIGDEYTDVASRTGWLLTGQAFLVAAFVTALNAERLTLEASRWLAIGIGASGAMIAFILALSIFYGHALIHRLKRPRDAAEEFANDHYHIPVAGVPVDSPAHFFGHYATRFIPTLAYMVWVVLTILVMTDRLQPEAAEVTVLFPSDKSGRGWSRLEASPPFAVGSAEFKVAVTGCWTAEQAEEAADEWIERIVQRWKQREGAGPTDSVVLIGGADRIPLGNKLKKQYDANIGLARRRAEVAKERLMKVTANDSSLHRLNDARIVVLVTGPRYTLPLNEGASKESRTSAQTRASPVKGGTLLDSEEAGKPCNDPQFGFDRRVEVYLPDGG